MSKTTLISFRIDDEDLKVIDEECNKYKGTTWSSYKAKRSYYINSALNLYAELLRRGLTGKVDKFYPRFGDVIDEFKLEYHRKVER